MTETVTQAEYARRHGVQRSTVTRWVRAGKITLDDDGRVPVEEADRQIADNRRATGHGGARRGAGRPRTGPEATPGTRRPAAGPKDRDEDDGLLGGLLAARAAGDAPMPAEAERAPVADLLHLTHDELAAVVAVPADRSGLSQNALDRLRALLQNQELKLKIDERAGRLIDAAEAERAWARTLQEIRSRIEQQPARLAQTLADRLWPDLHDDLLARMLEAGVGPEDARDIAGLASRPTDLVEAVRRVVAEDVLAVCGGIAGAERRSD